MSPQPLLCHQRNVKGSSGFSWFLNRTQGEQGSRVCVQGVGTSLPPVSPGPWKARLLTEADDDQAVVKGPDFSSGGDQRI